MLSSDFDTMRIRKTALSTLAETLNSFFWSALSRRWVVTLLLMLICIPFFEPGSLGSWGTPHLAGLFYYWKIASAFAVFFLFLFTAEKERFSSVALCLSFTILLSCSLNDGGVKTWFEDWAMFSAAILLVSSTYKCHLRELLLAVLVISTAIALCNLVSIFLYPNGVYDSGGAKQDHFFYGHRNKFFHFVIPSVGCSLLLDYLSGRHCSIRTILLALLGGSQFLLCYSATSCLAAIVAIALLLACLIQLKTRRKPFNGLSVLVTIALIFLAVVVLRMQDLAAPFIVEVLDKTTTFTGRTIVWDRTISLMDDNHMLLGYGTNAVRLLSFNGLVYYHTHNEMLWVWFVGGYAALLLFSLLLVFSAWSLFKARDTPLAALLTPIFACFLVIMLMEISECFAFPFFLGLFFYLPKIASREKRMPDF